MILNFLFINIIYKNLKNHIFPFHCINSIFSAVGILFLNPLELKYTKINEYEKPKANYTRELLNAIPGNHFKFKVS